MRGLAVYSLRLNGDQLRPMGLVAWEGLYVFTYSTSNVYLWIYVKLLDCLTLTVIANYK